MLARISGGLRQLEELAFACGHEAGFDRRHASADHQLRSIDRFVDLSSIRDHLRPYADVQRARRATCRSALDEMRDGGQWGRPGVLDQVHGAMPATVLH